MVKKSMFFVLAALVLASCDSATGPEDRGRVEVRFQTVAPVVSGGAVAGERAAGGGPAGRGVEGTNGTLILDAVWLVVAEFELSGDDDFCPDSDDDCYEFEAPPFFVELPLDENAVVVATDDVPAGIYDEFEFEVEDLDDDDEDDGRGASELMATIRAQFSDWPEEASVLVTGSFTPSGGEAVNFRVYLDAEIEIERSLDPPLAILEDDPPGLQAVVVEIDPSAWFLRQDGTVWDLSLYDYDRTGELLEFELELEDGFLEIEVDDY